MPREKMPPRLYLDPKRKVWVVRYEHYFKRTKYKEDQREKAEAYLNKILTHSSWVRGLRTFRPNLRGGSRFRAGTIYFLSKAECNTYPIKIGFCAGSIERRIIDIQTGNPEPLALLASVKASYRAEQQLHSILAGSRLAGEWFSRSDLVVGALEAAKSGGLNDWIEGH